MTTILPSAEVTFTISPWFKSPVVFSLPLASVTTAVAPNAAVMYELKSVTMVLPVGPDTVYFSWSTV